MSAAPNYEFCCNLLKMVLLVSKPIREVAFLRGTTGHGAPCEQAFWLPNGRGVVPRECFEGLFCTGLAGVVHFAPASGCTFHCCIDYDGTWETGSGFYGVIRNC